MIRTAVFYVVLVLSTAFFSSVALLGGLLGAGQALFDWVHRNWSRSMLIAAGVKVEVRGLEHLSLEAGQIIVANHQSYFDIWALMGTLPGSLRFVAKKELARIPLLAPAMRRAGHVFIDRDQASSAKEAIRAAGRRVHDDRLTLVLFAEGTRSRDGRLGRFRRGSFGLAIEMGGRLVPTAIAGGHHVFPPDRKSVRRGTITVRLAPSIELDAMEPSGREVLMSDTRTAIAVMLDADPGLPVSGTR